MLFWQMVSIKNGLFFLILFFFFTAGAQQVMITGRVVDAATSKPLSSASVFINGTTKGTVTDADGRFQLLPSAAVSYELIVSFIGYKTVQFVVPQADVGKKFLFELSEMEAETEDVLVEPDVKDGWNRWGKTFIETFIGKSELANKCKLKNPEVLRFKYNSKTGILKVIARDALLIENSGLGYNIRFQLEQYEYKMREGMVGYVGYQFFTPIVAKRTKREQKYIDARLEAYNGSLMHFVRSAYRHTLAADGFEVRKLKKVPRIDSTLRNGVYYKRTTTVSLLDKNILPDTAFIKTDSSGHQFLAFRDFLDITYTREKEKQGYVAIQFPIRKAYYPVSQIWLPNNTPVQIDANGLYFDPLELYTNGYWGWEKLAETVPNDYEPGD